MKYLILIYFSVFCSNTMFSQNFEWNENCISAYEKVFQFRFQEAENLIEQENEQNRIPLLLKSYIQFFKITVQENQSDIDFFNNAKDNWLKKIDNSEDSPYKRFLKAEINLHSGFIKLRQEEYLSAFWDIRRAYKLYLENEKMYPNFGPNKKGLGILEMLIGTIPEKYQWGVKIVGLDGDLEAGAKKMEDFIYNHPPHSMQEEAKLLYVFVKYFIENDEIIAKKIIYQELQTEKGMWHTMTIANLANAMGDNDFAITTLENCPRDNNCFPFPTIDLMLGICKLNRLDENADKNLLKFLETTSTNTYKKECYQKLAWHALINNNLANYELYISKVVSEGDTKIGEDKQALQEAKQNFIPNVNLLKARLLFDGAYYKKALEAINQVNPLLLEKEKEQVEYNYRLGRILQRLERYEEAIEIFNVLVASEPTNTAYYFAPKVLLELGGIYEGRKEFELANSLYQKVKSYNNHPYVDSFAQQAKSAQKRIKEFLN